MSLARNESHQAPPARFHSTLTEQCIGISFTVILMLLTIFMNVLVMTTIMRGKQIFNTSYLFILNLCVANCLVGIFSMPWWILLELYPIYDLISMLDYGMQFFIFVDILGGVASILSLTVISVIRWLTVTHPLNWMVVLTRKRSIIIVSCVWVYGMIVASMKFVHWPQRQSKSTYHYDFQYIFINISPLIYTSNIIIYHHSIHMIIYYHHHLYFTIMYITIIYLTILLGEYR